MVQQFLLSHNVASFTEICGSILTRVALQRSVAVFSSGLLYRSVAVFSSELLYRSVAVFSSGLLYRFVAVFSSGLLLVLVILNPTFYFDGSV